MPFGLIAAGQATIEVERSRFHALALPVSSHETFLDDLARRREAIREASHHVWAWRMGPASHRYSDDGEPRGTGGRPLLDLLERRNLVGVGIIVSRIFGGRLLGRPRLLRTFAHAGLIALNAAPLGEWTPGVALRLRFPWALEGPVRGLLERAGLPSPKTSFGDDVTFDLTLPAESLSEITEQLRSFESQGLVAAEICRHPLLVPLPTPGG